MPTPHNRRKYADVRIYIAWLPTLKPTAPSSLELICSNIAPTAPALQHARPLVPILPNTPTFSAPSTTASDVSSDNPNNLLTSKPDITLGLAHNSFTPVQKRVLRLLQDDSHLLSDPHQAQIGLRFPFLVVETKGGAASGNMIGAQNQAAVDGACVMNILGDFHNVVTRITTTAGHHSRTVVEDNEDEDNTVPAIVFSVTTEGPLHEIWVHYQLGDTYQMTCHRAWRTTRFEDASDFVRCLTSIVNWGRQEFRDALLKLLGRIERPVLDGVLSVWDEEE
jgi:hypothetical protein